MDNRNRNFPDDVTRPVKVRLALIVLLTAAVPAFAQTAIDGTGTQHGFVVTLP